MKPITVVSRAAWRQWLTDHHDSAREVWLTLYKKHVVNAPLSYDDAVEEALCFGWIDGMERRIDNDTHMLRFTPRRPGSNWAASNIARARKLIKAKQMTPAGLQAFNEAKLQPEEL